MRLRNKHNILLTHFFKYLQLRSCISKAQIHSLLCPPLSMLEKVMMHHSGVHGQVIHDLLKTKSEESSENRSLAWGSDLDTEITKVDHEAQVQNINTRFRLLQYKWIIRTYVTLSLLHHFDPIIQTNADKDTLFSCLWDCPRIK